MAVRAYTATELTKGVVQVLWTGLLNTDTGSWYTAPAHADRSLQVYGTFGGATLTVQGTNETGTPSNAATLNDPSSTALTVTAAKIEAILEPTVQIRPSVAGGDGTTTLTMILLVITAAQRR